MHRSQSLQCYNYTEYVVAVPRTLYVKLLDPKAGPVAVMNKRKMPKPTEIAGNDMAKECRMSEHEIRGWDEHEGKRRGKPYLCQRRALERSMGATSADL